VYSTSGGREVRVVEAVLSLGTQVIFEGCEPADAT